jgi:hypothetical protein
MALEESQQQSCGEDLLVQSVRINEIPPQGFGTKHLGPRSIGRAPMIQLWKRNQAYHDHPCLLQCGGRGNSWSCGVNLEAKWWNLTLGIKEFQTVSDLTFSSGCVIFGLTPLNTINGRDNSSHVVTPVFG